MIRFFSLSHLALALTLSTSTLAITVGTCRTGAEPECAPTATYMVTNGQDQIIGSGGLGFASNDGKLWLIDTDGAINNESFQITFFNAQFNADPFVLYALGVVNNSTGPLTFSFSFLTPYLGGPYNQGTSSFGLTAATLGTNVVVTTGTFANLHNPDYDGTPFGVLGTGCTLPAPGGNCDSGSTSAAIATAAAGNLSVAFSFTLSGSSSAAAVGTAVLENSAVPEPATVLLTACGLLALGLRRRR